MELHPSEEKDLVLSEAKGILDVEDVIASILLVDNLKFKLIFLIINYVS